MYTRSANFKKIRKPAKCHIRPLRPIDEEKEEERETLKMLGKSELRPLEEIESE
jgi:hypothetical protein